MGAGKPCAVPGCLALTDGVRCAVHQHAAVAASLPLAVDRRCERCQRVIAKDDWIESRARVEVLAGVLTHHFRHVGCRPPKATRKTLQKTGPPLPFGDDAEADSAPPSMPSG